MQYRLGVDPPPPLASASSHVLPLCLPTPILFFLNPTAPTDIYTLSLHDALPIWNLPDAVRALHAADDPRLGPLVLRDRKSTRLNSSHVSISYAVFCLQKKRAIHAKRVMPISVIFGSDGNGWPSPVGKNPHRSSRV